MLFLIPLAEPVIGRVCPLVTLRLIPQLRNTLYQSPRNKLKQEFPLAKLCTCLRNRMFPSSVSPLERYIISRVLTSSCLDLYSGDRASELGRVYTKEVLLLPEDQGLLFQHTFGKTLRRKDSKNQFAINTCPQDTMVCHVVNLPMYFR